MKLLFLTSASRFFRLLKKCFLVSLLIPGIQAASAQVTQQLTLKPGWNSVWLEVETRIAQGGTQGQLARPEEIFTNAAIVEVAKPLSQIGTGDFSFRTDENANSLQAGSWAIWRRSSVVSQNTLLRIEGSAAYLVKVTGSADIALSVTGRPKFFRTKWKPDSHNLTGFGVDATNGPTFRQFFRYSDNRHPFNNIYGLNTDGTWALVDSNAKIQPGTAYWVYSTGNSDYMGPVAMSFPGDALGGLDYGSERGSIQLQTPDNTSRAFSILPLTFTSLSTSPVTPRIEKVFPATATVTGDDLRVYRVIPNPGQLQNALGGAADDSLALVEGSEQPLALGESRSLFMGGTRVWSTGGKSRENIYRVVSEIGGAISYVYLPIRASQPAATNGASTNVVLPRLSGLWVGEVQINDVSSIVEQGSPVKAAATTAPIKVILHTNSTGDVKLLSAVTWMRERAASNAVTPGQVLVLNNARIPFYEGIESRGGKIVGRRIETSSYDMPRKTSPADQGTDLVNAIVAESNNANSTWTAGRGLYDEASKVTSAAITSFLQWSPSRPPSLKEEYVFSWPLEGKMDAGSSFKTSANAPLRLDPFHRSNPFRHAFHPSHGKGQDIQRSLEFDLDTDQTSRSKLNGTYTEIITGLIGGNITARGRFTLQRVNEVVNLVE